MTSRFIKRVAAACFGDYHFWAVWSFDLPGPPVTLPPGVEVRPLDASSFAGVEDPEMAKRADFAGECAQGYGLYADGRLSSVQWYWWGARYEKERRGRSWPLPPGSAKSVGFYTLPEQRGKGHAALLKQYSANLMHEKGFTKLYSRIWHSHRSSIRVSEKAGWKRVGFYVEFTLLKKRFCYSIPFRG